MLIGPGAGERAVVLPNNGSRLLFDIKLYGRMRELSRVLVTVTNRRSLLDQVGDDCAHDPVLKSLIEQLILAQQMIGRLYADAIAAASIDARRINVQLATTLTGELRRLSAEICEQTARHHARPVSTASVGARKNDGGRKVKLGSNAKVA